VSALFALIAQVIAGLFGRLLEALRLKRQDGERDDANRKSATAEAEVETQDVLGEIADARSRLPVGGSADDIASRLRKRRNFGNPGDRSESS
jgi:hypothetical protein